MEGHFRSAGHLPKQREDGRPASPRDDLPRQRRGSTPQDHGRYPDYDVLEEARHWDPVTRSTVVSRLQAPPLRFLAPEQARTLSMFCDDVLAQDDEPRVPVLAMVDERLHERRFDGYRYADMPEDDETWVRVARGLDEVAGGDYAALGEQERIAIITAFAAGELSGGVWDELPPSRAWSVVMRYVLAAFYAHPWAWNEIGFGGPRYPRGYMRLQPDAVEPGAGAVEAFSRDPVRDTADAGPR